MCDFCSFAKHPSSSRFDNKKTTQINVKCGEYVLKECPIVLNADMDSRIPRKSITKAGKSVAVKTPKTNAYIIGLNIGKTEYYLLNQLISFQSKSNMRIQKKQ